jgi:hypothetical protein
MPSHVDGSAVWQMRQTAEPSTWEGIDLFRLRGELAEHGIAHFDPATAAAAR